MLKKKYGPVLKELYNFLPKKFVTKLQKIWGWDPGSGIRDPEENLFRIPDPGPGSKRHWIPDPDPQHCLKATDEKSRIRIRKSVVRIHGSGSVPKCHPVPQHCSKIHGRVPEQLVIDHRLRLEVIPARGIPALPSRRGLTDSQITVEQIKDQKG
jgi:hypothetical protein